jgi:hypothetical protein
MSKFEKKAPIVDAFCWDGTIDGAKQLVEWLHRDTNLKTDVTMRTEVYMAALGSAQQGSAMTSSWLELDRGPKERMQPGDWIVSEDNGVVRPLDSRIFARDYQQIDGL